MTGWSLGTGVGSMNRYEQVLRHIRYRNWRPATLEARRFRIKCSELNGRYTSNEFNLEVSGSCQCPQLSPPSCRGTAAPSPPAIPGQQHLLPALCSSVCSMKSACQTRSMSTTSSCSLRSSSLFTTLRPRAVSSAIQVGTTVGLGSHCASKSPH